MNDPSVTPTGDLSCLAWLDWFAHLVELACLAELALLDELAELVTQTNCLTSNQAFGCSRDGVQDVSQVSWGTHRTSLAPRHADR